MRHCWLGCALALLGLLPGAARAHIGNPTTIYEGFAGPVPVRVSVRTPGVVPGLAQINVRLLTNGPAKVTALPAHWQSGPEGQPPPDTCQPVSGEPNLYHGELWLMVRGAYSVNVAIETAHGSGNVIVPVNSVATEMLPMPRLLGGVLLCLGIVLFALAVTAAGAAVRESVLAPGVTPSRMRLWLGRATVLVAASLLTVSLHYGRKWWLHEESNYRNNRMHKPAQAVAEVREGATGQTLHLTVRGAEIGRQGRMRLSALVPDHGKLMHVFLVRHPEGTAFAHLHPLRRGTNEFESALPPLPAGRYQVYADVTHETGFSQTLTTAVKLAESPSAASGRLSDEDDSWFTGAPQSLGADTSPLGDGFTMRWDRGEPLAAGQEATLRFRVLNAQGAAAEVEPYMSMLAHAIVRREDGAVFTHLHPAGTVSVASQQVFQLRAGTHKRRRITPEMLEALCQPPGVDLRRLPISFPYEFPKAGRYRIWVQVKIGGAVRTGVFDAEVAGKS